MMFFGVSELFVVVLPLTGLTRGMIGLPQPDARLPGAVVTHIASGRIVEEIALIERLRGG